MKINSPRSAYPLLLIIAALAMLNQSCKPKLDLAQRNPNLQSKEARILFRKLGEKPLDFTWITGKIDCKATFKGEENELSTDFRIRKDSLVWLSVKAILGVEAARVRITSDSVMFFTHDKKYYAGPYDYLQQILKIEDLDLCFVQSILLGEPLLMDDGERWKGEIDSVFYVLKNVPGKKLRKALGITKDEDFDQPADSLYLYDSVDRRLGKVLRKNKENDRFLKRYFLDEDFRLVKMLITDVINNRLLEINYSNYGQIDSLYFPQHITVDISDPKEHNHFDLLYTKIKTEAPESISFKIPKSYEAIKP